MPPGMGMEMIMETKVEMGNAKRKWETEMEMSPSSQDRRCDPSTLSPFFFLQVQTSVPGTFPTQFGAALTNMRQNSASTKFPFGSLVPLWSRQIPYTMAKFYFFEKVIGQTLRSSLMYIVLFSVFVARMMFGKGGQQARLRHFSRRNMDFSRAAKRWASFSSAGNNSRI